MIDATVYIDGRVRCHPESTASLTIHRDDLKGETRIVNRSEFPVSLNGEGIEATGRDVRWLAPGKELRVGLVVVS